MAMSAPSTLIQLLIGSHSDRYGSAPQARTPRMPSNSSWATARRRAVSAASWEICGTRIFSRSSSVSNWLMYLCPSTLLDGSVTAVCSCTPMPKPVLWMALSTRTNGSTTMSTAKLSHWKRVQRNCHSKWRHSGSVQHSVSAPPTKPAISFTQTWSIMTIGRTGFFALSRRQSRRFSSWIGRLAISATRRASARRTATSSLFSMRGFPF